MSTPPVLRWPMPGRVLGIDGQLIACPTCGAGEALALGMDLDDHTDAPSYMSCQAGHSWAEERLPRRLGAELLATILDIEPGLLGSLDELRDVHGGTDA
ncbi:hypothetical protein [Streptomyces sp. NPDC001315]|uniref:hypothetical protein n=1 Tax=Streptomyces sp. NPDC001315 TaxID=3364562 RepID=UPI0036C5C6A0